MHIFDRQYDVNIFPLLVKIDEETDSISLH